LYYLFKNPYVPAN